MSILVNLKEKIKFNKNILFFFQSFLFIVITIFLLIYPISIKAEISKIDSVSVEGNQRIETQTILAISGLSEGKSFSENQINQALLLLNASTFFEDFVFEEILKRCTDEERLVLMIQKLGDEISTIMRQIAAYNFETELHSEYRKNKYLKGI